MWFDRGRPLRLVNMLSRGDVSVTVDATGLAAGHLYAADFLLVRDEKATSELTATLSARRSRKPFRTHKTTQRNLHAAEQTLRRCFSEKPLQKNWENTT
jgi:hypothetical protein